MAETEAFRDKILPLAAARNARCEVDTGNRRRPCVVLTTDGINAILGLLSPRNGLSAAERPRQDCRYGASRNVDVQWGRPNFHAGSGGVRRSRCADSPAFVLLCFSELASSSSRVTQRSRSKTRCAAF